MKWLTQFSLIMRSNVTSLKETFEDPQRMLHQLIIDMEEELDHVRKTVAETIADEIQLRKRVQREREEADKWLERATQAVQRGQDANASSALEQKMAAQLRADKLGQEHAKQETEVSRLRSSVLDLEDKIRQTSAPVCIVVALAF